MTITQPSSTGAGVQEPGKRLLRIFHGADAAEFDDSDIMSPAVFSDEVVEVADFEALSHGYDIKVLFRDDSPGGFSLIWAWFGADYPLPRHTHDSDCLYYVISGQAIMGKQVLGPGSGLFVPAGTPYRYTPGPEGVQILEFRKATSFDIDILDQSVDHWREFMITAHAMTAVWDTQRPTGFG